MANGIHGMSKTRIYNIWKDMKRRCNNPNRTDYYLYGERGIQVCDEWKDFVVFNEWANLNNYSDHLTIDRIDNDRGYSPSNCKWVTKEEQQKNTRNNILVEIDGILKFYQIGVSNMD